jgi:hypothetical protein
MTVAKRPSAVDNRATNKQGPVVQSNLKRFFTYGWVIPISTLATLMLIAFLMRLSDTVKSEVIAAWVQGVGSLLAIIAAVVLYVRQYEDKRADDANETRAFVQAIRDEVETVWNDYSEQTGALLRATPAGKPNDAFVPNLKDGLIIYRASPSRLGRIDDNELRKLIVTTYVGLTGHFNSLTVNNQMLVETEQLHSSSDFPDKVYRIANREKALAAYADALKKSHNDLQDTVKALLAGSEAWLASHPAR